MLYNITYSNNKNPRKIFRFLGSEQEFADLLSALGGCFTNHFKVATTNIKEIEMHARNSDKNPFDSSAEEIAFRVLWTTARADTKERLTALEELSELDQKWHLGYKT